MRYTVLSSTMMRGVQMTATAVTAAMIAGPAWGQCMYEVAELADWDCPLGQTVVALAVNDEGVVAGYHGPCFGDGYYACMWPEPDELVTLDFPGPFIDAQARDINSQGLVVGYVVRSDEEPGHVAFTYDGSAYVFLPTVPDAYITEAYAVNEKGTVTGGSYGGDGALRALLWRDGEMLDLSPDIPAQRAQGYGVNDADQVVGWMGVSPAVDAHAFIWDDGEVTDLGIVPGGYTAQATAINNRGEVVGKGRVETRHGRGWKMHPFRWADGTMTDLTVGTEWTSGRAWDINDLGQIVGDAVHDGTAVGFLWQHGKLHDLNGLVPPRELKITYVYGINNLGQIVAERGKGILLTPIDRPQGDVDCDCKVGVTDLVFLLSEWSKTESLADLNKDGIVDVLDLLILLGDWSER